MSKAELLGSPVTSNALQVAALQNGLSSQSETTHIDLEKASNEQTIDKPPGSRSSDENLTQSFRKLSTQLTTKVKTHSSSHLWRILALLFLAALIGVSVPLGLAKSKKETTETAEATQNVTTVTVIAPSTPTATPSLSQTILQPSSIPPIQDAGLGVTIDVLSTFFATASSEPLTKLAYDGGDGKLCIRTKSGDTWLNNVQCIEGADPKPETPITVLDWLGGTSIYFIAKGNFLSGIDNVPKNDTYRLSSLRSQNIATHDLSQLSSVTWLNGTSAWVYYQDPTSQLREVGMDDYRDGVWRDGSVGPLGLAINGTGVGVTRWLKDGGEAMEVFIQVANNALHGRTYINNAWTSDWYDIDGTPGTVSEGTSIIAATIDQVSESMVILAYVSKTKFLTAQWRVSKNASDSSTYSAPKQLLEGDGSARTGLAAVSVSRSPKLYFVNNHTITEISAPDVAAVHWTISEVSSS